MRRDTFKREPKHYSTMVKFERENEGLLKRLIRLLNWYVFTDAENLYTRVCMYTEGSGKLDLYA